MALTINTRAEAVKLVFDQFNWIDQNRIEWFKRATTDLQRTKLREIYWDANHHYDLALTLALLDDEDKVKKLIAQIKDATEKAKQALASLQAIGKGLALLRKVVDLVAELFA